jgi:hypothetical protein
MSNSGALLSGTLLTVFSVIAIVWYVVYIIAGWKIFQKAGEAGWKSLIPFYNIYIQFKFSWKTVMVWPYLICGIAGTAMSMNADSTISMIGGLLNLAYLVLMIISYVKLAKAFGKGGGFAVGLLFLEPIFIMILGFGSAQYIGPEGIQAGN